MELYFDVVIVGAGISGIAAAHHIKEQCRNKTFAILEKMSQPGGTWRTHKYPGVRSDSDLYTYGYRFKPWSGKPVAEGYEILRYLEEVIEDDQLDHHIHYGHTVYRQSWSSKDRNWTITTTRSSDGAEITFKAGFLFMCQGYYDHDRGYTPDFESMESFKGKIIHPQTWPSDLDCENKKLVVIGSGATAATLVPNLADKAEHVTMLQRSPTYFFTHENRNELADQLRHLEIPEEWIHEIVRRKMLADAKLLEAEVFENPERAKAEFIESIRDQIGDICDVDTHFTPRYPPWHQRIAYLPDGDLLQSIKAGKVSILTDEIQRFRSDGIELKSGGFVPADIVITATGFNLSGGGIQWELDGRPIDFSSSFTWRGMMYSDVPNVAGAFGYLRTSWTMRVELICDLVCGLLNYMTAKNFDVCIPTLRPEDQNMESRLWVDLDNFNPGYLTRAISAFPKRGNAQPWEGAQSYHTEKDEFPAAAFDDGSLFFQ